MAAEVATYVMGKQTEAVVREALANQTIARLLVQEDLPVPCITNWGTYTLPPAAKEKLADCRLGVCCYTTPGGRAIRLIISPDFLNLPREVKFLGLVRALVEVKIVRTPTHAPLLKNPPEIEIDGSREERRQVQKLVRQLWRVLIRTEADTAALACFPDEGLGYILKECKEMIWWMQHFFRADLQTPLTYPAMLRLLLFATQQAYWLRHIAPVVAGAKRQKDCLKLASQFVRIRHRHCQSLLDRAYEGTTLEAIAKQVDRADGWYYFHEPVKRLLSGLIATTSS